MFVKLDNGCLINLNEVVRLDPGDKTIQFTTGEWMCHLSQDDVIKISGSMIANVVHPIHLPEIAEVNKTLKLIQQTLTHLR